MRVEEVQSIATMPDCARKIADVLVLVHSLLLLRHRRRLEDRLDGVHCTRATWALDGASALAAPSFRQTSEVNTHLILE